MTEKIIVKLTTPTVSSIKNKNYNLRIDCLIIPCFPIKKYNFKCLCKQPRTAIFRLLFCAKKNFSGPEQRAGSISVKNPSKKNFPKKFFLCNL